MRLFAATAVLPFTSAFVPVLSDHQDVLKPGKTGIAPAIGLHLTSSYAIATLRHKNGTIETLARVKGNAQYVDQMAFWSDFSLRRNCESESQAILCTMEDAQRFANKAQGRAATVAVKRFATLLSDVKNVVEAKLRQEVKYVYPVMPVLAVMEEDDLRDALRYAGLVWSSPNGISPYYETTGAYAGMGHGLCASFHNISECKKEESTMQLEHVLFLNFDNSSFSAVLHPMQALNRMRPNVYITEPNLGWWSLAIDQSVRTEQLAQIESVINDVVTPLRIIPSKIILLGDHAHRCEYHGLIKRALWRSLHFDASSLLEANDGIDSALLAANGAAELAFRMENAEIARAADFDGPSTREQQGLSEEEVLEL
ncbi:hypothetical protein BU24DRAFT_418307 [Aaosphaeria arxii CBS 175.79]|uniref:Uncharacterized protein n=1 Tax=Aaosphaeria arxii CBS 175.79 TaxID=1450172 RepID=A0A6A5XZN5_9PLEO|nr:uncharacterized protein BU24DRAFT_418307 [Aaosphaeria arxii CBS 175.79]KAF2018758.1 hypothetical protein BU24DRAFT_418307 [Aaosphaeria arxii CBS 175.79]